MFEIGKVVARCIVIMAIIIAVSANSFRLIEDPENAMRFINISVSLNGTNRLRTQHGLKPVTSEYELSKRSELVQVNYYWDGACSNYAAQVDYDSSWTCYNYYVAGSWSSNIANCYNGDNCQCWWFATSDCVRTSCMGTSHYGPGGETCFDNQGQGVWSFTCGIDTGEVC